MRFLVLIFAASLLYGADCSPSHLNPQQTLQKFQELDRAAQSAFDAGRLPEAVAGYREAACLAPQSARAFFGLGGAEAAAGNFKGAKAAFTTASKLLPNNSMPLAMLLRVNVALNDANGVKEVLRAAAERFPKDAELHSTFARFLAEKQMLELALAESLRFHETGAEDPESAVTLAILENTVGAYDDAAQQATAVQRTAGLPDAVKAAAAGVAGLSYENLGQNDTAAERLRLSTQLAPNQENSWLALADLYEKTQKNKEAAAVLSEGLQHIPESVNFLLPLGNNLILAEQYQAGIDVLVELVKKVPKIPEAYAYMATAYQKLGQTDKEIEALRNLAQVKPDYPMIHIITAQALLTADTMNSVSVLQELAAEEKKSPNDADVFFLRGKLYLKENRNQDAVVALKRAVALRPLEPTFYYQLGIAYRKLNQPQLAQEALARMAHLKQLPARP